MTDLVSFPSELLKTKTTGSITFKNYPILVLIKYFDPKKMDYHNYKCRKCLGHQVDMPILGIKKSGVFECVTLSLHKMVGPEKTDNLLKFLDYSSPV